MIKFLGPGAEEYKLEYWDESLVGLTNEQLAEQAGIKVYDMIIEEYDKCDREGYVPPDWLLGGVYGFIVGEPGKKDIAWFDWQGCTQLVNEEIKSRPPKIIVPDQKIITKIK